MEILSKRQPIAELLDDPAIKPELKRKLATVLRIRDYASKELHLPDNRSYRTYADLERPFVLWNVFATPEFSLKPKEWCFIITGCVAYRGYFSRDQAEKFAAGLRAQGFDVYVAGVTAYSTLGWFRDPMLNTILRRSQAEIAGLMFHELAHQRLYVRDDTTFNESFATTVELEGVRRWLETNGTPEEFSRYEKIKTRRRDFVALIRKHRKRLVEIYDSPLSDEEKRLAKQDMFAAIQKDYKELKKRWGGYSGYDGWFALKLNNAHLASVGTYHRDVQAFQALLARHKGDLKAFYRAVEELSRLPFESRAGKLRALAGESP